VTVTYTTGLSETFLIVTVISFSQSESPTTLRSAATGTPFTLSVTISTGWSLNAVILIAFLPAHYRAGHHEDGVPALTVVVNKENDDGGF
jgi:hypothetical protein